MTRVYYCSNKNCTYACRKKDPPVYCPKCGSKMEWVKELNLTFVVSKRRLKASGFGALWDPADEWWRQCPQKIIVTITGDEVRYCFDEDRGYHFDDYYERGQDAVKAALELLPSRSKNIFFS